MYFLVFLYEYECMYEVFEMFAYMFIINVFFSVNFYTCECMNLIIWSVAFFVCEYMKIILIVFVCIVYECCFHWLWTYEYTFDCICLNVLVCICMNVLVYCLWVLFSLFVNIWKWFWLYLCVLFVNVLSVFVNMWMYLYFCVCMNLLLIVCVYMNISF